MFDSSLDRGQPIEFPLGQGQVSWTCLFMAHSSIALTHFLGCRSLLDGIKAFLACGEHPVQQIGNDSSFAASSTNSACNHYSASKLLLNTATYTAASCGVGERLHVLGRVKIHPGIQPGKLSCRYDWEHVGGIDVQCRREAQTAHSSPPWLRREGHG